MRVLSPVCASDQLLICVASKMLKDCITTKTDPAPVDVAFIWRLSGF